MQRCGEDRGSGIKAGSRQTHLGDFLVLRRCHHGQLSAFELLGRRQSRAI
jgi:hypothetical protein